MPKPTEMIVKHGLTRFDVLIEDRTGEPMASYPGIIAQTKSEAINKVKQELTFTAERSK